jgi:hypothetical protein
VEFALATLEIALNAWNSTFLQPLLMEFGAVYLWALRAQKWPLETVKRHENRVSPATERQTKRRDTPSTD